MANKIRTLLHRLFTFLVGDVPAESARCEFICDKLECPPESFASCVKRKQYRDWNRES